MSENDAELRAAARELVATWPPMPEELVDQIRAIVGADLLEIDRAKARDKSA